MPVLDPRVGVLVALVELDALHELLLHGHAVLGPDRVPTALGDVALARADHLKKRGIFNFKYGDYSFLF